MKLISVIGALKSVLRLSIPGFFVQNATDGLSLFFSWANTITPLMTDQYDDGGYCNNAGDSGNERK